ncbi:MAG: YceI family protein [Candidatus Hydrogenedentes bacterium]|nr:YceI family protein [Candidatus Hydrogenedentota bacterium]
MKKILIGVVLIALGAAAGGAAGYKFGVEYGKKAAEATKVFERTHQTAVVDLKTLDDAKPAPAPAAAPEAPVAPVEAAPADAPVNAPAAAPAAAPEAPAGDAVTYALSLDDTFIDFIGYKTVAGDTIGMSGRFDKSEGTVTIPGGDFTQGSFSITIDTPSIGTENAILTGVLKTAVFFDIETYPTVKIESKKIEQRDGKYVATVAWTMRDKTVGVEIPLDVKVSDTQVTALGEVRIDRNLWGVGPGDWEIGGVRVPILPDVLVKFEVLAKKS